MPLIRTARARRFGVIASASALVLALVAIAAPATAATPAALSLAVTAAAPSADTGTPVDFTIRYDCSGGVSCDGASITVPLPNYSAVGSPDWGFSWWKGPTLTSSPDIASASVGPDGTATFTFTSSVATGTSGTLRVRYTPTTQTTPDGATMTVTASVSGSNVAPASASDSMILTAADHATAVGFYHTGSSILDQNLSFTSSIGLLNPMSAGVEGIDTIESYIMTLPVGAQFISSDPAPSSVVGNAITWTNVPTFARSTIEPGRRFVDAVVAFPSAAFSDKQEVTITAVATGKTISGAEVLASGSTPVYLMDLVATIEPQVQVLTTNYPSVGSQIGRGAPYRFALYLNNYNSTITAATSVLSTDIPATFIVSSIDAVTGTIIRWTAASGATGSYTATTGTRATLDALGLAEGDVLAHLDLDYGALPGATAREAFLSGTTTDTSVSTVQLCASAVLTSSTGTPSTASGCGAYRVVDPFVSGSVLLRGPTGSDAYRPGDTINWSADVYNDDFGALDLEPVVAIVAPAGTTFPTAAVGWDPQCTPDPAYGTPTTTVNEKAVGGQDVLIVSWPGAPGIAPGAHMACALIIKTTVTNAAAGHVTASVYLGDARGPISSSPFTSDVKNDSSAESWATVVRDNRAVLPGSTGSSIAFRSTATAATGVGASLTSTLSAQGSLDDSFVSAPLSAATESGKSVRYKLPVTNTGNVPLTGMVIYDVLPFVGDTGVSTGASSQPRGSQFAPTLLGAVAAPGGFTVEYSASTNPCRPEVNTKTAGCVDDWTTTPVDYSTVRALRFMQNSGASFAPGAEADFTWTMQIGQDVPAAHTAYNSVAFSATRTDDGTALSAEPAPVGVQTAVSDLAITLTGGVAKPDSTVAVPLTVTNHGPSATIATVVVSASDGFSFGVAKEAANSIGWTCEKDGDTLTCVSSAPLASGASDTPPIVLTVGAGDTTGIARATVSGPYPDPDLGNNAATASFFVSNKTTLLPPRPVPPTVLPEVDPNTLATSPTGGLGSILASTGSTAGWIGAAVAGLLVAAGTLFAVRRRRTAR